MRWLRKEAPFARGQNKAGPSMPRAKQCVTRMQLATMEVPGYYDRKTPFVEEVLDDTMFVVWQNAWRFNNTSRLSTWIFGLAHHRP
jgi:hypothetical protein